MKKLVLGTLEHLTQNHPRYNQNQDLEEKTECLNVRTREALREDEGTFQTGGY